MSVKTALQYEVQKVLDKRIVEGKNQYRILWKGYYEHEATWQPQDCLQHSRKKIKMYEKEARIKRRKAINQIAVEQNQKQLVESNYQLVSNFKELEQLLSEKHFFHNPIPFVKMGKPRQPITTFECLLSKPPNQMIKVQRFDSIAGQWKQKLQTCSSIIAKTSTRQKKQLVLSETPIKIEGISTQNKQYIVHFVFKHKMYKCQLKILRLLKPQQIIQFLLERYDPTDGKTKISKEIYQYLNRNPQRKWEYFD